MKKLLLVFCVFVLTGLTACGPAKKPDPPKPPADFSIGISPTSATVNTGGTKSFIATISGVPNTIKPTFSVPQGTITDSGTFTAPSVTAENLPVTTTISYNGKTKSATAYVKVVDPIAEAGFEALKYYESAGANAEPKAVVVTNNGFAVAINSTLEGASESLASLVLYDKDLNFLKEWRDNEASSITAMAYDSGTDKLFVSGSKGSKSNPSAQQALFLIVSATDLTVTDKSLQVDGEQSESVDIAVRDGKVILPIRSTEICWENGSPFPVKYCSSDFVGIYDEMGNTVAQWIPTQWPATSNCRGSITGVGTIPTFPDIINFNGTVVCNGIPTDNYESQIVVKDYPTNNYTQTQSTGLGKGGLQKILWGPYDVYYPIAPMIIGSTKDKKINVVGQFSTIVTGGPISWAGEDQGFNESILKSMILDKKTPGVLAVGSLKADGSADTVGGIVSIDIYNPPYGASIRWGKVFKNLPFNYTITSLNGVMYANPDDLNKPDDCKIIIVGTGSDGKSNKKLVVIGKSRYTYNPEVSSPSSF